MIRCWNCGLPDVAERCPRCGAPQEQARRGTPPPAGPPETFRPPPGFIVNGSSGDRPPPGRQSGPLPPGGNQSGPLRPMGNQSGPLRPAGNQSGPLRPAGFQSGPLPPAAGYPPRNTAPGGRPYPPAGPPGWDEPDAPRRGPSMPLPSRSRPLPPDDERVPPEYRRSGPQSRSGSRPPTRPTQPPRGWDEGQPPEPPYGPRVASGAIQRGGPPAGWEDERVADAPYPAGMGKQGEGSFRAGKREAAPQQIAQRAEPIWDEQDHWGWSEPDALSLSSMTNAVLGGAIGGVLGGAVWVAAVVVTGIALPYLTVVVGLLAGLGARFALVQTRPWIIGAFGAAGAALAFLVTQYSLFDYALIHQGFSSGLFPLSPLQFPQVYIDYVTGEADSVTSGLGFVGQHPLAMAALLGCMLVCWGVLLPRKK